MKRSEAEEVFHIVCAVYDVYPSRAATLSTAWIPALEDLEAKDAMTVIEPWLKGRGPERMPTLPVFVTDVLGVAKRDTPGFYAREVECEVCLDGAWVIVGYASPYAEQTAPCPSCVRGKGLEFPLERVGPFGKDGYWRGRSWSKGAGPLEVEVR